MEKNSVTVIVPMQKNLSIGNSADYPEKWKNRFDILISRFHSPHIKKEAENCLQIINLSIANKADFLYITKDKRIGKPNSILELYFEFLTETDKKHFIEALKLIDI